MKKIYLLFYAILISIASSAQVSSYTFTQSNGTYQELLTGTSLWTATSSTSFDTEQQDVTIPFNFNFNGTSYTTINVNSNGSLILPGTTTTSTTSSPISATTSYNGAIAGWGRDINGAYDALFESSVSWEVLGTTPNRVLVVQYKNVRPTYSSSSTNINLMNFQIRLEETTNVVRIIYGSHSTFSGTTVSSSTVQIGLRGASNSDFFNRTNTSTINFNSSISGTSNSNSQAFSTDPASVQGMPGNGLTYTFTPPVDCTGVPVTAAPTLASQIICNGSTPVAISVPFSNPGFIGFTYQWEESDDNGATDPWANVTTGTGGTALTYTPASFVGTTNKYYRLKTTCTASGQSSYSSVHTVLMATSPNPVTNLTFTNISDSGVTVNWDNANGNRRVLLVNTTNSFTPLTSTGPAYTNGTQLSGGDLLIWDGTASTVNITGMDCNTIYYFRIYEYVRCGTSPNYDYWHAVPLDGNVTTLGFIDTTNIGALPISNDFTGFSGSNLSTVFPNWLEKAGDGPLTGTTSNWTSSTSLTVTTAKINLYTNTRKEWIVSPTIAVDSASRMKFKAAITNYASASADPDGMQGTDDKVQVMITSDICGATWVPLYTFNAATTTTLTNVLTDYIVDIPVAYIGQEVRIGFKATDGPISDNPDYDFHITDINIDHTPPPTIDNITTVDNLCFGNNTGSATVVIKDGASPFTYEWLPTGGSAATATNLIAGTYTITITDAINRSVTDTITINQPDEILTGFTYESISCNGNNDGSASVTPSGGVGPYDILWSTNDTGNTISNLVEGSYTVTITDSTGCTVIEDFDIIDPAILDSSISNQSDVTVTGGNDGSATINVIGGSLPYTYAWTPSVSTSDTASNLIAGTYTVLITDDNGCTTNETIVIREPIALNIVLVSKNNISCNGANDGEIIIDAIGDYPPFTYSWSPSGNNGTTLSNLSPGTYTVTLTDANNEMVSESFTITEPTVLNVSTNSITHVSCNNGNNGSATAIVSGGTAPFNYIWSNGETTPKATNLTAGNHFVHITDANGCQVKEYFNITQPDPITINTVNLTNVSCNGQTDGSITISVSGGIAPYTYSWNNGQTLSSLSNLMGGNYSVIVTDSNGCSATKNFVIVNPAFVYPPTAVNQGFCSDNNPKLSDVIISGNNIKWYDAATGGNLLPATTTLTNGTTYYATQTINGCESTSRATIQVSLSQSVSLITLSKSVCYNSKIQDVVIDGLNYNELRWYSSATASTALSSTVLLSSATYYISTFTNNTCESTRQAIQITVLPYIQAPVVTTQVVCGSSYTLNDLVVGQQAGTTLNWYASTQATTPLAGTTSVLSGTYYVEQSIGSCSSVRVPVSVQAIPLVSPSISNISVCVGTTIGDFNLQASTKYVWYTDSTTTTPLAGTTVITSGTFYVAEEISGCISNRSKVSVNVNAREASPTGQLTQTFNPGTTIASLQMNETGVEWYASSNDAINLTNRLSQGTLLINDKLYYGVIRGINNCPSTPTAVKVVLKLSVNELDLTHLKYYPNPIDTELNIEYNEAIKKVEIYTITGQKVLSKDFNENQVKLDLSNCSSGTYMIRVETEKASQFIKILKK